MDAVITTGRIGYAHASGLLKMLSVGHGEMMNAFRSLWDGYANPAELDNGTIRVEYFTHPDFKNFPYRIVSYRRYPALVGRRHMGDAYVIAQMPYDSERIIVLAERPREYVIWTCYGSDGFQSFNNGRYIPKSDPAAKRKAYSRLKSAALPEAAKNVYRPSVAGE